jgi:DNA polymerase III sliding clamp (beta) subunit (PCNA family)
MDYARFSTGDAFDLFGEDDVSASHVALDAEIDGEAEETIYSMNYLERISKALHVGKVDEIELEFGTDFPLFIEFEREDAYSGVIMLAPRVQAE